MARQRGEVESSPRLPPEAARGEASPGPAAAARAGALVGRVGSIDAFRGMVMLLMMGEVLEFNDVARELPGNKFMAFLASQQTHVPWIGCTLHDLIQPSFSFLVGVALPFSLARRATLGQPLWLRTLHAFWRALILVLLGVFLRSTHASHTYWTFEDTLTQIGLGYGFLYLLAQGSTRIQWAALVLLLVGYWAAFAAYPTPGPDFPWDKAGVSPTDATTHLSGFAEHWSKNTNIAWTFDRWFLNLFRPEKPFNANSGGYCTLSFIPTLATMILGLLAGGVLRSERSGSAKVRWLLIAGAISMAAGWTLGATGVCPIVKRIWTPSWVLFSGGWCFFFLAAYYLVIDLAAWRGWAFVLKVVGMNSIAAYLIAHLWHNFIAAALPRHLGTWWYEHADKAYHPLLIGAAVLLVEWLILLWMYQRKIFLRI